MIKTLSRHAVLVLLSAGLVACSSWSADKVLPDKSVEYKREKQAERNLELPPDLTSDRMNDRMSVPDNFGGVSTSYSEYVTDRKLRGVDEGARRVSDGSVLPQIQGFKIVNDGGVRYLLVQSPVEEVWPRVIDFWQENGILMLEQDPSVGVMRTSWLENRAEIKRDIVTDTIRSVFDGLYETGTRDQYRVRLERAGNGGATEVYMTHFGMEEEVIQSAGGSGVENTVWVPRERDPQLEAEMLRRLMVYLGAADERARTQLAARGEQEPTRSQLLNTQNGTVLLIDDSFSRAWRLVGLSLDRVGFAVEDRDRSAGIYYVRYNDPSKQAADKSFLQSLAFWSDDDEIDKDNRYQVKVGTRNDQVAVAVADEQGKPDNSPTAVRILTLLQEQIR
ncbi:outer membrane protein assembly factor BamC [Thiosocius teredinicola]|uniref:outer membrane protein assembly factor BamC n=1 Tax=Thiosocius teredinicola TaxID=1973002 RepID=UPI000990B46E